MESPDHVVLPSHVTNENDYISTTRVPMATKLGRMVAHLDSCYPQSHMTLWSRDLARFSDKPKPLYLHYHSANDLKTWQDVDLSRRAPSHKVTQRSDHVVLQVTWLTKIIIFSQSECLWLQTWQNDTQLDEVPPIRSHHPLITWSCEITWQTKTQYLWPPN